MKTFGAGRDLSGPLASVVCACYSLPVRKGFTKGLEEVGLLEIFLVAGYVLVLLLALAFASAGGH